jgi:hypothetical protein
MSNRHLALLSQQRQSPQRRRIVQQNNWAKLRAWWRARAGAVEAAYDSALCSRRADGIWAKLTGSRPVAPVEAAYDSIHGLDEDQAPSAACWTAQDVAEALDGVVDDKCVLAPKEDHSAQDRSLRVMIGEHFPDGYFVCSAYDNGEDIARCSTMCFASARSSPHAARLGSH